MMRRVLAVLREWKRALRNSRPIITIEISRSALLHNISAVKAPAPGWGVVPVLKSNAYGHGLTLVAEALEGEEDIPFFAVDSYFEAETLRAAGITKPLLVLGYSSTGTIKQSRLRDVSFTVASLEQLRELAKLGARVPLQVKFDTGMHRRGIDHAVLEETVRIIAENPCLVIEGVLSHLADSETLGSSLTKRQIERWNTVAKRMQKEFPSIKYFHLANSGGFAHSKDIVANVGRLGIALYGFDPGNLGIELLPALSMSSTMIELRPMEKGETVGYNATFVAERSMRIAIVAAGYYEGVDRRLSNKGAFLVAGRPAPILGRVSMNMSSCDVTDIPEAKTGTPVVIVSDKPKDPNSVVHIAQLCGTIPYEILVHIPAHLYRVLVD